MQRYLEQGFQGIFDRGCLEEDDSESTSDRLFFLWHEHNTSCLGVMNKVVIIGHHCLYGRL